jgi:hypothetical protein
MCTLVFNYKKEILRLVATVVKLENQTLFEMVLAKDRKLIMFDQRVISLIKRRIFTDGATRTGDGIDNYKI